MQEAWVRSMGWEDPLEKETAIHSSILAWRIPWTEEPGGLESVGSQESDTTERLHHHRLFSGLGGWTSMPLWLVPGSQSLALGEAAPWRGPHGWDLRPPATTRVTLVHSPSTRMKHLRIKSSSPCEV